MKGSGADLCEGLGGNIDKLSVSIVAPTGQGAIPLHTAGIEVSGADLREGLGGNVVKLTSTIVSPTG